MISLNKLKSCIIKDGNDLYFTINGKNCGMETEVVKGVFSFLSWCGQDTKQYADYGHMLNDKFYDGYSLADIAQRKDIQIDFY